MDVYAESIIQQSIEKVEAAESVRRGKRFRIHRFPVDLLREMLETLDNLRLPDGKFKRDLTPTELAFIENELVLCRLDFRHYSINYAYILSGSREGGKVLFRPAGSQELLLERIAQLEVAMWEAYSRGQPVDGICLILHKARQLGATIFAQLLLSHRDFFVPGYRALTASMDDQATQAVHARFARLYDNLPWWMQPAISFRTKERGMRFGTLDSSMELQDAKQTKGLGQGEQWDGGHLTECASWGSDGRGLGPGTIQHDFLPTVPYSLRALLLFESTAQGRSGWWYDFTEQVRNGITDGGAGRFTYTFIPYYAIDQWEQANGIQRGESQAADGSGLFQKYRRNPPPGWSPSDSTLAHARMVEETSTEWMNGRRVVLDREVLYWYETERELYRLDGRLNSFYTNYAATPEESFQHVGSGAFDIQTIDRIKADVYKSTPWAYTLMTEEESRECASYTDLPVHRAAAEAVGLAAYLGPVHPMQLDKDPRGIVWLWEQPGPHTYFVGSDPTSGIPGWTRAMRQHDDINTDNGTIEIGRKGGTPRICPDCRGQGWTRPADRIGYSSCPECKGRGRIGGQAFQVAEFAAPLDAEDLARWIWVLSRVYAGNCGMDEALTIVENNNTGLLTIRKLLSEYGHTNLYRWRTIDGEVPKYTNSIGWLSSAATVPVLHARSKGVIDRQDYVIRSRWLAKELEDAVVETYADGERRRFQVPAGAGRHDDRMAGTFFMLWALFDWTESADSAQPLLTDSPSPTAFLELAATDCTAEEQQHRWNDAIERYLNDINLDDDDFDAEFAPVDSPYDPDDGAAGW